MSRAGGLLAGLLSTGLVLFAYLPVLDVGFHFDDRQNIEQAEGVHWSSLSPANLPGLFTGTAMPKRVVANLSFALNHAVGGLDPRGYHLVNLLLHLAVGVSLVWLCLEYLRGTALPGEDRSRAFATAFACVTVFLVHPLNTQAVTYVVQRMTSLAALFSIACFASYLTGRRPEQGRARARWFALAGLLWLLSVGSKETAFGLPLVVAAYEWAFHRTYWASRGAALLGASRRAKLLALLAAAALLVAVAVVGQWYAGSWTRSWTEPFFNRDFSPLERVLTQPRVQGFYLGLLAWPAPSRLNLDHEFPVSRGLLDPGSTLPALLAWALVLAGALLLTARRPRLGFPLLAYLALHVVESGPVNLELVFEHRMYLPMAAATLLLSAAIVDLPTKGWRAAMVLALAVCLPLAGATRARNRVWTDAVTLYADCAAKSPGKFRPQYNLGTELGRRGRVEEAVPVLERAVRLDPAHSEARNQLGNAYLLTSRADAALEQYRTAVRLDPTNAEAVYNLAVQLERRGRYREAIEHYRSFARIAPTYLRDQAAKARERVGWLEALSSGR